MFFAVSCDRGNYNDPGTEDCLPCAAGYYKDTMGIDACTPCVLDFTQNNINISIIEGASSLDQCDTRKCFVSYGFFVYLLINEY